MAFCFSGSLLRANINIEFSCLVLLLFVANKFLLLLRSRIERLYRPLLGRNSDVVHCCRSDAILCRALCSVSRRPALLQLSESVTDRESKRLFCRRNNNNKNKMYNPLCGGLPEEPLQRPILMVTPITACIHLYMLKTH